MKDPSRQQEKPQDLDEKIFAEASLATPEGRQAAFQHLAKVSGWRPTEIARRLKIDQSYPGRLIEGLKTPGKELVEAFRKEVEKEGARISAAASEVVPTSIHDLLQPEAVNILKEVVTEVVKLPREHQIKAATGLRDNLDTIRRLLLGAAAALAARLGQPISATAEVSSQQSRIVTAAQPIVNPVEEFMREALREARNALHDGGIPIGSVLVCDGKIIGRGRNQRVQHGSTIHHAEMNCLENAGRLTASVYHRCTMYSTLSPCPMCSGAILLYGIPRVIVGENVSFKGPEDYVRSQGVNVEVLQEVECIQLLREFIANQPQLWNEDIGRKN